MDPDPRLTFGSASLTVRHLITCPPLLPLPHSPRPSSHTKAGSRHLWNPYGVWRITFTWAKSQENQRTRTRSRIQFSIVKHPIPKSQFSRSRFPWREVVREMCDSDCCTDIYTNISKVLLHLYYVLWSIVQRNKWQVTSPQVVISILSMYILDYAQWEWDIDFERRWNTETWSLWTRKNINNTKTELHH